MGTTCHLSNFLAPGPRSISDSTGHSGMLKTQDQDTIRDLLSSPGCISDDNEDLKPAARALNSNTRINHKQLIDLAPLAFDYHKRLEETRFIMEPPNSRGLESGATDWTALDFVGSAFDDTPSTRVSSPLSTTVKIGCVTRSENSCDAGMQGILEDSGTPRHSACSGILDDQLLERLRSLCGLNSGRCPEQRGSRELNDHTWGSVNVNGRRSVRKISPRRKGQSDAESLRILESCTPTSCNAPGKRRSKSKLEALSDSESLQVLEYWTRKRAGEKMWG
ncbi:hypothetical protein N0V93_001880 [Gnomoniopsis smithogilvyi]|uniref:Uncharacterized protein n=1 Tax=Gnomoniopsis smithogilvyi TaxID=1191159 RepID=A0A9W8Z6S4_9PEZI|nr:hypothetical protein N0V93_001880 [Gnomoniopsis smithogilvyi]